jgi:DNA-binding response OmpR family regulator
LEKVKVLIIEDDELAASLMSEYLADCGFLAKAVYTVTDGLSFIKNDSYDILLLDLNLPDFSGFDLLKEIKNRYALPIIITSAYSETSTKVKAFNYGASDYIVKPIDFQELEARIWALLGRHSKINSDIKCDIFYVNGGNIYFKEKILDLTSIEFELLKTLIENRNQTITRKELSKSLSSISSHRSLDHHIKNIRIKLEKSKDKYLRTEYGLGYKLVF